MVRIYRQRSRRLRLSYTTPIPRWVRAFDAGKPALCEAHAPRSAGLLWLHFHGLHAAILVQWHFALRIANFRHE